VIARKLFCGNKAPRSERTWEILTALAATCHQRGQDFVEVLRPCLVFTPARALNAYPPSGVGDGFANVLPPGGCSRPTSPPDEHHDEGRPLVAPPRGAAPGAVRTTPSPFDFRLWTLNPPMYDTVRQSRAVALASHYK
jgi:hypothetical protein